MIVTIASDYPLSHLIPPLPIFFDDKDIQTQCIAFEDTWGYKNIQDSLAELKTLYTYNLYTLLNQNA